MRFCWCAAGSPGPGNAPREARQPAVPGALVSRYPVLVWSVLAICARGAHAEAAPAPFDGTWTTILSCTNSNGALGYSFEFPSSVTQGVLHGEKGTKGEPGWLTLDGHIQSDGAADLYVNGLVGAAAFAVGQRPA